MRRATLGTISIAAGGALLCSLALAGPVEREGRGERREALNSAEAAPFNLDVITGLKDWANGSPLTRDEAAGNVVVIVTLDSAKPGTMVMGPMIRRLNEQHAGDGLIVVGLHPRAGWDNLDRFVESGLVQCRVARDALGMARKALRVDDDPDVYVIDRAGQLRYADISNASVADAVAELVAETPEHARGEAARRKTEEGQIAAGLLEDPNAAPEPSRGAARGGSDQPTINVPAAAYAKADWPGHMRGLKAKDYQGEAMPVALGNEQWLSDKVETEGKVLVIDFWATWCGPCRRSSPILDKLQKQHKGELEVLAISGSRENAGVVKRFLQRDKESYSYLHDDKQTLNNAFGVRAIPHSVVVSTDGVVRWQGNPLNPAFADAVKQVVRADPMLQARAGKVTFEDQYDEGADAPADNASPADVDWPAHSSGASQYASNNLQGQVVERPLARLNWMNGASEPDTEGKVIIVDFWATWCGPCKRFSPTLDKVAKKHASEAVVVAISGQNDPFQKVESFLKRARHSYYNAHDNRQSLYKKFGINAIPNVVVMSSDGVVRWQGVPGSDFEQIVDQVVASNMVIRD